jgi:hypothetical protein
MMHKLLRISLDKVKRLLCFALCESYFKRAISVLNDSKNLMSSLSIIQECNYYYEECHKANRQFSKKLSILKVKNEFDTIMSDLEELKSDFELQANVLRGLQSKQIAQDLFKKCIELENFYFNILWEVIDWYRDSIIKTRGQDIECEAEVSSDLGYIYDKVLKDKVKAKSYFQSSWHLADSLRPKIFTRRKWYQR